MRCLSPITIQNPAFGKWWLSDGHLSHIQVPCGKCYPCLSARRLEWSYRLSVEAFNFSSLFVTLTYNDETIGDNVLNKKHLQDYFKRLRSAGHKFSYYAIGEYGTKTKRAHYHVLFFLKNESNENSFFDFQGSLLYHWKFGYIKCGSVSASSINYVLHYHVRPKKVDGKPTFSLMSKGLGLQQVNDSFLNYLEKRKDFMVSTPDGRHYIFPRYYRKKFGITKEFERQSIYDYFIELYGEKSGDDLIRQIWSLSALQKRKLFKYNEQEKF